MELQKIQETQRSLQNQINEWKDDKDVGDVVAELEPVKSLEEFDAMELSLQVKENRRAKVNDSFSSLLNFMFSKFVCSLILLNFYFYYFRKQK